MSANVAHTNRDRLIEKDNEKSRINSIDEFVISVENNIN